ncbi:carbonic anhydrase-like [Stomoxys calcitrans]|uniref:carbonic anhydrase-like n=1 Tax=Stomoxys calcitrans TaxID=35570 RepID=UPI0027E2E4DD|nr:carbonic anhydrase-like [Stomoxys calcitrans]
MTECSLCSLLNNGYRCIMEYPLLTFILSLLIVVLFIFNIYCGNIICYFPRNCGLGDGVLYGGVVTNFDYGPQSGPHTWQVSDTNQSPINIIEKDARRFAIRELLMWNHYDDMPSAVKMENNGHTVVIRAAFEGNTPTISGADLLVSYTFVELCFRWSLWNNEGSEHMLNYRRFPMEIQAMHRTGPAGDNISSYDLLMVAYFLDISSHNPYLEPIVQNLHRIRKAGSRIEIPPFPLVYLCYPFRTGFYSYGGSLTEPPCYQGVEWFVYPEPLAISESQLNEFRQLLSADGRKRIVSNARPVQDVAMETRVVNLN